MSCQQSRTAHRVTMCSLLQTWRYGVEKSPTLSTCLHRALNAACFEWHLACLCAKGSAHLAESRLCGPQSSQLFDFARIDTGLRSFAILASVSFQLYLVASRKVICDVSLANWLWYHSSPSSSGKYLWRSSPSLLSVFLGRACLRDAFSLGWSCWSNLSLSKFGFVSYLT